MAKKVSRKGFEAWLNVQHIIYLKMGRDRMYNDVERREWIANAHAIEEVIKVMDFEMIDESSLAVGEYLELSRIADEFEKREA